jgi:hydroxyacylglutathione hydrolase
MLLRTVYDDTLAQAAYLIGCQKTGEAILFDPERDIDRYLALASREGLRITAIAETHIHADFLSGARELAEREGARVYVSGEGRPDWTYQWLDKRSSGGSYPHQELRDGDTFRVGSIEFRVLHTPGHTPEHISFCVTDGGSGASEPMGIITGDFVFVGDLGRPDLLETAAGLKGAAEPAARAELQSVTEKLLPLPDYLQVWPGHGAGSACGKALGAVPQTTVGYERRFNPAIGAAKTERGFIDFILAGQPEPPIYFARMKRDNKNGPRVLGELPRPQEIPPAEFAALDARQAAVIDTRPWEAFRSGHLDGALFAPVDAMFPNVVGSYVPEDERIFLVCDPGKVEPSVRLLVRIGLDRIAGWLSPAGFAQAATGGARIVTTAETDAAGARERLGSPATFVLDVRRADEFAGGHITGATHVAYPRLPAHLELIPKGKQLLVNCRGGGRSARACAYLQRLGYDVTNLEGGYSAWEQSKPDA